MSEKINLPNESIRYYTGLVRELESIINSLKQRVKALEDVVAKLPTSPTSGGSIGASFNSPTIPGTNKSAIINVSSGGGFSEAEIKNMFNIWASNGESNIPLHDHTDNNKGGDAFAEKGAKLQ